MLDENNIRQQLVNIAAKMYSCGYITGYSGNLSARLPDGKLLVTPAGVCKGELSPEQLLLVDPNTSPNVLFTDKHLTSELPMHLEVYHQRPDVGAVIHAHPSTCVALTLVGITLEEPFLPEAIVLLGSVPTAPYATPSSQENQVAISNLIGKHNAIILDHHGTLTVGKNLAEAYHRLEVLEHTACTLALAHLLGKPQPLSPQAVEKLYRVIGIK